MNRSRYDLSRPQVAELLADAPRYRVDQVWEGLYRDCSEPDDWTTLPRALREHLSESLPRALTEVLRSVSDDGQTIKYLWDLADGNRVETVLMLYPDRATVCVSSQAGCAMACGFCATGQAGFARHLGVGEIV
ncbi:MAG: 23S rRNA (adenine(2503)-C(2))-methyltransferase RlmN, partial [Ilumatobacteraceae bacterium]